MMLMMATWQENEKRDRRGFLREEQSRSPLCRNLVSPLVMMVVLLMIIMVMVVLVMIIMVMVALVIIIMVMVALVMIVMVRMVIIIVAINGWGSVRIMIVSYKGSTGSGV